MTEQNVPLTIADLKKGTQLINPDGYIIVVEGSNASGMCIVTPFDEAGKSVSIPLYKLNNDGYKVHLRPEASDSINYYDIFDGLIIENKEGDQLTIQEIAECKVVVESEKGNTTVTSLEELKQAEYYLLKPEQKPQERIIFLSLDSDKNPFLCIASNVIEFGYSFLNIRKLSRTRESQFEETSNFNLNYSKIDSFRIYENLEEAEKELFKTKGDQENPDGK